MTPPGLTCVRCEAGLYPTLARATDDGWAHTVCPNAKGCPMCHAELIGRTEWDRLTAEERETARNNNRRRKGERGYCSRCVKVANKDTTPAERRVIAAQQRADRLEDIRWMCDTGESFDGACVRLGLTDDGLRMFLRRAGEREMLLTLLRRNPVDANSNAGAAREAWFERVAA